MTCATSRPRTHDGVFRLQLESNDRLVEVGQQGRTFEPEGAEIKIDKRHQRSGGELRRVAGQNFLEDRQRPDRNREAEQDGNSDKRPRSKS